MTPSTLQFEGHVTSEPMTLYSTPITMLLPLLHILYILQKLYVYIILLLCYYHYYYYLSIIIVVIIIIYLLQGLSARGFGGWAHTVQDQPLSVVVGLVGAGAEDLAQHAVVPLHRDVVLPVELPHRDGLGGRPAQHRRRGGGCPPTRNRWCDVQACLAGPSGRVQLTRHHPTKVG